MGVKVGLIVGVSVGVRVGDTVGSRVGESVGVCVGEGVGCSDGDSVGYHFVFFDAKLVWCNEVSEEESVSHHLRKKLGKVSVQVLGYLWVSMLGKESLIYINHNDVRNLYIYNERIKQKAKLLTVVAQLAKV